MDGGKLRKSSSFTRAQGLELESKQLTSSSQPCLFGPQLNLLMSSRMHSWKERLQLLCLPVSAHRTLFVKAAVLHGIKPLWKLWCQIKMVCSWEISSRKQLVFWDKRCFVYCFARISSLLLYFRLFLNLMKHLEDLNLQYKALQLLKLYITKNINISFQIFPASCQWLSRILGSTDKIQMLWKAEWLLIENIRLMACKCAAWIGTVVSCVLISAQTKLLILCTVYAYKWLASLSLSEDSCGTIIIYQYKYISCSLIQTAKNTPTAEVMAEPCYWFLVVVLPVLLLKLFYTISSMLYVCPVLLCISYWHVVGLKTFVWS